MNDTNEKRLAARQTLVKKLRALGIRRNHAERIAHDEFAESTDHLLRNGIVDDQRVMPHPDGWVVTRLIDKSDAVYFRNREKAELHALRTARIREYFGVLIYCDNGFLSRRLIFPRWR